LPEKYGPIVGRLLMWLSAGDPPIVVQYTNITEFQQDLIKIVDGREWIEIRSGKGQPDFEEYIKASAVIRYMQEVWV
jgi:hypothetical protein